MMLGCFEEVYGDFAMLKERSIQHFGALLQSVIISVSEQHVVRELRTHSQHLLFWSVYNCLCVYRYFSRYSLRAKHTTFLSSTASFVHRSFSFSQHLTLPIVGSTFQMTDRHDPSRYLNLPQTVRLPAVKPTSFLNFTIRHAVSRGVISN